MLSSEQTFLQRLAMDHEVIATKEESNHYDNDESWSKDPAFANLLGERPARLLAKPSKTIKTGEQIAYRDKTWM